MPSFSGESEFVQWHIPSKFSEQMRKICSGKLFMLFNYITLCISIIFNLCKLGSTRCPVTQYLTHLRYYSVARYRSAQSVRTNHDLAVERLEGFVPVIEGWHARLTLVKVLN